jgi:hypothetical protein
LTGVLWAFDGLREDTTHRSSTQSGYSSGRLVLFYD